jgi:urease accessory protein
VRKFLTTARKASPDSDPLCGNAMTQFSVLARREDLCDASARYLYDSTDLDHDKRTTESGCRSPGEFNSGPAMLGTSWAAHRPLSYKNAVFVCSQDRRTGWCNSMLPLDVTDSLSRSHRAADPLSDKSLQRADGCGRLVVSSSENGTRIEDVFERSPTRIMFPRTGHCPVEEAVMINTGGGVAGGDRLQFSVAALPGASIAVTSQAAEKVYRALHDPARVTTRLKARESARLAWLPQESIIFNGARIHRTTEIELFSEAELLALEWLVLGRAAHGEIMVGGSVLDGWRVKKDGRLIWADSFRISDEIFVHLNRKALLSDFNSIATLVYFGPDVDRRLEFLREILSSVGCDCGVTSVGGLIVARFAAKQSSDLKLALRNFLQQFESVVGPGPFRVPKMWSC